MLAIAIDGACRRNGKPDCVSAGGVFIMHLEEGLVASRTCTKTNYELQSTNQRGELLALLTALDYVHEAQQPAQIVTDSEYIFNTMTKEWYANWMRKGWITSSGDPVKNQDIWMEIVNAHQRCVRAGYEIDYYHIKGHAISFGKVTAAQLLQADISGMSLYKEVDERLRTTSLKEGMYDQLVDLSLKNNGFKPDSVTLRRFIASNIVADSMATKCVEAADLLVR